jgi:hypothetical protein
MDTVPGAVELTLLKAAQAPPTPSVPPGTKDDIASFATPMAGGIAPRELAEEASFNGAAGAATASPVKSGT